MGRGGGRREEGEEENNERKKKKGRKGQVILGRCCISEAHDFKVQSWMSVVLRNEYAVLSPSTATTTK